MKFDPDLVPIEKILADLYSEVHGVTRIIQWAGLDVEGLYLDGAAIDTWHGTFVQACSRSSNRGEFVHEVIKLCIEEKKSNDLKVAYDIYCERKQSASSEFKSSAISNAAYVELLECQITFCADISFAQHEYYYDVRNFGYREGEDSFYFKIPNARPEQVTEVTAAHNKEELKRIRKEPFEGGARLTFKIPPPIRDNVKLLRFSYKAPSTHWIYQNKSISVGSYHAELYHDFEITKYEKVIIKFPDGTDISPPLNIAAEVNKATVTFEAFNVSRGEKRTFPIFFNLKRTDA
jgi:hypothetical protein